MQPIDQLTHLFGSLIARMGQTNAQKGNLNIALMWNDASDLDIHVICPCGSHIHHANRQCSNCKGTLDVDMNRCPSTASLSPVENVFWPEPPLGHYKIYVQNYQGRIGDKESNFKCLVTSGPKSRVFNSSVGPRKDVVLYNGDMAQLFGDLVFPANQIADMGSDTPVTGNYDITQSPWYDPCMPPSVAFINLEDRTLNENEGRDHRMPPSMAIMEERALQDNEGCDPCMPPSMAVMDGCANYRSESLFDGVDIPSTTVATNASSAADSRLDLVRHSQNESNLSSSHQSYFYMGH